MHINNFARMAVGASVLGLAACSGGAGSSQPIKTANVSSNTLQLAVGTANLAGTAVGLNVATTYRQTSGAVGDSGTLVNDPTFTGPFVLPATAGTPDAFHATITTGPGPAEISTATMTSTSQVGTNATSFGADGGVFGLGIEPFNYSESGVPDNIAPYVVPLYDTVTSDPNQFLPWGGPPAFDPNHNGQGVRDTNGYPSGTLGISEGLDVFESDAGFLRELGFAQAQAPARLAEHVAELVFEGDGHGTATGTATLPDTDGPGKTESLCTSAANTAVATAATPATDGDQFSVQVIGFDYPIYEASYPNSLGQSAPKISGANGQADVSISAQTAYTQVAGAGLAPANVRAMHTAMAAAAARSSKTATRH